eukprot:g46868.t1
MTEELTAAGFANTKREGKHTSSEDDQTPRIERDESAIHREDGAGKTPLFFAAQHGHLEDVKWLVEKGAEVDKVRLLSCTSICLVAAFAFLDLPNKSTVHTVCSACLFFAVSKRISR